MKTNRNYLKTAVLLMLLCMAPTALAQYFSISPASINIQPGVSRTISVSKALTATETVSGFQFDVNLPDGLLLTKVEVGSALPSSFTVITPNLGEGRTGKVNIMILEWSSVDGASIGAGEIAVLTVKGAADAKPGEGGITFSNGIVSGPDGSETPAEFPSEGVSADIEVPATAVNISSGAVSLLAGQTYKLTASVVPDYASNTTVTWSSTDMGVATVGTDGTVTAVATGTADIKATCGDVSATCKVTVTTLSPGDVTVTPGSGTTEGDEDDSNADNTENGGSLIGNDLTLRIGQTAGITLQLSQQSDVNPEFVWTLAENGDKIVTMTVAEGTLSASFEGIAVGTTTYSVKLANTDTELASGNIKVIAENPVSGMTLNLEDATLLVGQTYTLIAEVEPEDADVAITWMSDNTTVATVDAEGKVTALAVGTANITATNDDITATCAVTVKTLTSDDVTVTPGTGTTEGDEDDSNADNTENGGSLIGNDLTLRIGQTAEIVLTFKDDLAVIPALTWTLAEGGDAFVTMTPATATPSASFTGVAYGKTSYSVSLAGKTEILAEGKVTVLNADGSGVDDITVDGDNTLVVYNLQGVRMPVANRKDLKNLPRGVYIVNGEKEFVK